MSSRRHQQHGAGGVNLGLIITPMLDMSFQILAFFIMTYHPSALEGHIAGSLAPPEKHAVKGPKNQMDIIPQSVPEDQLNEDLQQAPIVIVKNGGEEPGKPAKIYLRQGAAQADADEVTNAQGLANPEAWKAAWEQSKSILGKELRRIKRESSEQQNIKIEADGKIQQDYVMAVYDICKQSGFSKIHFVPPPMPRAAGER